MLADGLAEFFAGVGADTSGSASESDGDERFGDALRYLSTHPRARARAERLAAAATPKADYAPALTQADWAAIKAVCDTPADDAET